MKVDLDGLTVRGISVGGVETCLEVPAWKLAFDLGRCASTTVGCETVLFTHAHADHMGAVIQHLARRALRRATPPRYVVPPEDERAFRDLLEVWRRLDRSDLPCSVVSVGPGEELPLARPKLVARVFRSPHRAPCQGYHVFSEHEKLLPELVGSTAEELAARRAAGDRLTRTVRRSELAFCGDTRFDVLEREESLRSARRLMLECTFYDDRVSAEDARAMGHVHLDEVAAGADLFRDVKALLLTHVSARYAPGQALALVRDKLPGWLVERTQVFAP